VRLSATLVVLVAANPFPHITGLCPPDSCSTVASHRHDGTDPTSSVCEGQHFLLAFPLSSTISWRPCRLERRPWTTCTPSHVRPSAGTTATMHG